MKEGWRHDREGFLQKSNTKYGCRFGGYKDEDGEEWNREQKESQGFYA